MAEWVDKHMIEKIQQNVKTVELRRSLYGHLV